MMFIRLNNNDFKNKFSDIRIFSRKLHYRYRPRVAMQNKKNVNDKNKNFSPKPNLFYYFGARHFIQFVI